METFDLVLSHGCRQPSALCRITKPLFQRLGEYYNTPLHSLLGACLATIGD